MDGPLARRAQPGWGVKQIREAVCHTLTGVSSGRDVYGVRACDKLNLKKPRETANLLSQPGVAFT
jgi:hypothetical protein